MRKIIRYGLIAIVGIFLLLFLATLFGDKEGDNGNQNNTTNGECVTENPSGSRTFSLGFSGWTYGPNAGDQVNTYKTIGANGDIVSLQIDDKVAWNELIAGEEMPKEFDDGLNFKKDNLPKLPLLISTNPLNPNRDGLAENLDGSKLNLALDDEAVVDAYTEHVLYLIDKFNPKYIVIGMEVNNLYKNSKEKWEQYKNLMSQVRQNVKSEHPQLAISESLTLHDMLKSEEEMLEMKEYVKNLDFVAISYYPFLAESNNKEDYEKDLAFLESFTDKPIAISETGQAAENYPGVIRADECTQNVYVETLLSTAQRENYEFVIWWSHRDFDSLYEILPESGKSFARAWRDTGLLDEDGKERTGFQTWNKYLDLNKN